MFGHKQNTIDAIEALAGHQAGRLVLVDVREASERARAYVPGSQHLPLSELKHRVGLLPANRPLAFICQSGRRSAMATSTARRAGLDASNVQGGMNAWESHGLQTERSNA